MGKSFEIITGSYEEFLLGYKFSPTNSEFTQTFAVHDHLASIRCLTFCEQYLASAGTDNCIYVYDLQSRKQISKLTHHDSTINCLQFTPNHTHLISGSSDGILVIVRLGNWQVEKIWPKAHKGAAVLDIAVHSTGKLALTLGADGSLCTWNLVKGRQAYIINLNSKSKNARSLEKILWASDNVRFLLYGGKYTEIWSIEQGGMLKSIEYNQKVVSCLWLSDSSILVGHENGEISIVDTADDTKTVKQAHESRVKACVRFKKRVVTVSSNGEIKVWSRDFEEIGKKDTGCRLTCLCVAPCIKVKNEVHY